MVIKSTLGVLAILLGTAMYSSQPATADSCGGVAVTSGCAGVHHAVVLRRGQIRRLNRRADRQHRRAVRQASRHTVAACAAPVARCGGSVLIAAPAVVVDVQARPSAE